MPSLAGHLNLVCSLDDIGQSRISHQSFSAPYHISKSYYVEDVLTVQVVNPTAGLFSGDSLHSCIQVQQGARLRLTTPSATRIHTMHSGTASVHQSFRVAHGGWLDYQPAPLIPQKNGCYRQCTKIELESGAEMLFLETLAPGRVASGEYFEFGQLDWNVSILHDKQLAVVERFTLKPLDDSITALMNPFSNGYYSSVYLFTSRIGPEDKCWEKIATLNTKDVLVGASRLAKAGWGIKILASDSVTMQKTIAALRNILSIPIPELSRSSRSV